LVVYRNVEKRCPINAEPWTGICRFKNKYASTSLFADPDPAAHWLAETFTYQWIDKGCWMAFCTDRR
jgi:hypothetical protein